MGPSESLIMDVKSYLDALFTIKDLGYVKYFLGLGCPISGRHDFTRPDISFAVQQLSQYLQHPTEQHWHAALHVVRYLIGTPTTGLFFPSSNTFQLTTYVDADWGACVDSRRSVTGYCVFLGSSLISWKTKKQNTVSRFSAEAKYRAMAAGVCELQWISFLLDEFRIPVTTPIPFWCDNQAALHITANLVFHELTKHLDIDCHVVRDKYKDGFISPSFISSKLQLADIFTKSLSGPSFHSLLSKLGLLSVRSPSLKGGVKHAKLQSYW
ncbi:UNVERIFIED_CONTAM: Retrovirus-related Pol polyprotein from transposon RE2 [Sesamum radiatum]|uniref:Retrovirus-related Pol polyprotein from transposon RE2 n=1 Tax=Sesamum radiatum TaxID=300843 RepID=A0AAW2V4C6_SESRA